MNNTPFNCEEETMHPGKCDCAQIGYQYADISIPIEICPDTEIGVIQTECCGEPCVQCESDPCSSTCSLVITQGVKIKIPVKIGIRTTQGTSFIQCADGCCDN